MSAITLVASAATHAWHLALLTSQSVLKENPKKENPKTKSTSSPPAMTPRRAATAALLGSALEYYDFFVYGAVAALVFKVLFFPSSDPAVALVGSFATFAVGYVARPVGAMVMGHFGDRLGRKRVMLATVVMMGVASFAIGSTDV